MKILVLIYPLFSMQEVSCLTEIIGINGIEITTCSYSREPVKTEDGFWVLPDCTCSETNPLDYNCVILPGMTLFPNVLKHHEYTDLLSQLQGHPEVLIAAISCAPVLLAKAGLLENRRFCGGLYNEVLRDLSFINEENFVPAAIYEDDNIITALGFAYREFAFLVADRLNLEFERSYFGPLAENWDGVSFTWDMDEENLRSWEEGLSELKRLQITD